jgi:hypothetical protein
MDVGDAGAVVGVDGIRASVAGSVVFERYGFTVEDPARALELLRTSGLFSLFGR